MTPKELGGIFAALAEDVMREPGPWSHESVSGILSVLAAAVSLGDEVALENVVYEWSKATYPDVYQRWLADKARMS